MPAANPLDLSGRTILVTGASSGLGRETAILLSELNARVVLQGRNADRLQETRRHLQGEGHTLSVFDLLASDRISEWLKSITAQTGPLHGFVHSAGTAVTLANRLLSAKRADDLIRTNLTSALMLAKAFQQKGCYTQGAAIVFLSSVVGLVGKNGASAYAATKAALIGVTRSLAVELAPERIRVNCIAPAMVRTEMFDRYAASAPPEQLAAEERHHPLGFGTPRDVAHAAAYLLAETGRWVTGTTLVVDGGYSTSK